MIEEESPPVAPLKRLHAQTFHLAWRMTNRNYALEEDPFFSFHH